LAASARIAGASICPAPNRVKLKVGFQESCSQEILLQEQAA
jgi:hypothetical protein